MHSASASSYNSLWLALPHRSYSLWRGVRTPWMNSPSIPSHILYIDKLLCNPICLPEAWNAMEIASLCVENPFVLLVPSEPSHYMGRGTRDT